MKTILIVEDDEHCSNLLKKTMNRQGWHVRVFCNGLEIVSNLSTMPSVAVVDFLLPLPLNGCDISMILKKKFLNLPILGITGYPPIDRKKFESYFEKVLYKPFRMPDFIGTVFSLF